MGSASRWRQVATQAGWALALRFLRQALSILVVAVLVRAVSQEHFGQYQLIVTVVGLCAAWTLPGMQRSIVQSVARGYGGTFIPATRLVFRFSLLGTIVLLGAAAWAWVHSSRETALAFIVVACLFPASQGKNQWQALQIGRRQFRDNTIRASVGVVGTSVLLMFLAWKGLTSLPVLAAGTFSVLAIQNIIQQRVAERSIGAEEAVEPGSIAYGMRSSIWDAVNLVGNYVDHLLLFALGSAEALAAYAVASRIPEVLKTNLNEVMSVLMPRFAVRGTYTKQLNRQLTIGASIIAVGLLVFAFAIIPVLIPFLYTTTYSESVFYCQLLLISISIGIFAIVKNTYITAKLDLRSNRNIVLWSSLMRILASTVLVWRYGPVGAGVSAIAYRMVNVALVEFHIRRRVPTADT